MAQLQSVDIEDWRKQQPKVQRRQQGLRNAKLTAIFLIAIF